MITGADRTSGPLVRVGGGDLLYAFFEGARRLAVDRLYVIAPYIDEGALEDAGLRDHWRHLLRTANASVVVRTAMSAGAVLKSLPERSTRRVDVRVDTNLHSKLFVGTAGRASIMLLGSPNLTGAALHANIELSVLLVPTEEQELIRRRLIDVAVDAVRASSSFNSGRTPARRGTESAGYRFTSRSRRIAIGPRPRTR